MKRTTNLAAGVLLALACMSTTNASAEADKPSGYEAAPKPGKTVEDLKSDLERAFRKFYVFMQHGDDKSVVYFRKEKLEEFRLSNENLTISFSGGELLGKGIAARDIEFTFRLNFEELAGLMRDGACSDPESINPNSGKRHTIYFSGHKIDAVNFRTLEDFRAACDAMHNLGLRSADRQLQEEQGFNEKAALYRALKTKPQVGEAQRRLIVQADGLTQARDLRGALERYRLLVADAPTIYPPAYSNMALLAAELKDFRLASRYMSRYLLLMPDAPDARAAQDKIYQWEMFIKR